MGQLEMFCERKNYLAREAHARRIANKTVENAEQCQSVQRQTYAHQYEEESAKQTEMQRKKQRNAKYKVTKAAYCENYNTNDITPYNIGRMNMLCPECKALYWIGEKVAGSKKSPIFSICYAKSTVQLPLVISLPLLLQTLLMDESIQAREF
ncbi:17617_t:CDS:1 [Gigaspora margarita]|uniref:17617_t:CDS:1 n=1 Tax=Gigaspora margarita TaxID=4874 RepID=A0ABN7UEG7_GIGMA|nr:17617_t:CDS:1 [Gigaspora margarita]